MPAQTQSFPSQAQLPADIADFAGRRAEVDALVRLIKASSTDHPARAVVISAVTGLAGVGKSTLAVHVGHRVLAAFPDGQLYVNLRGSDEAPQTPTEVLAVLLRDLGEPDAVIPPDEEGRATRFRTLTSQRRVLIVLDDARDAAQVRPLLPGSGTCAVLVTRRRRLPGLIGAAPLHLDVLEPAGALELFTAVVGAARVDAEPEAVEEVLRFCGGLPLAVRIAASRLASRPTWSVAALAARLADEHRRLDELQVEDIAVRTSFRVSFRELADGPEGTTRAARMFILLGLTTGPDVSLPASAALAGLPEPDAEEALEILIDANMVQSVAPDRYRLHDLLQVFSREIAFSDSSSSEETTAAVTRMTHWYIHTTAAAADQLKPTRLRRGMDRVPPSTTAAGFADRDTAWQWLLAERANLAALIVQADEQLPGHESWVLAQQASYFYDQRGIWSDTYETHQVGLRCARRVHDAAGRSLMLAGIAVALHRMNRFEESIEAARESASAAEQSGDRKLTAAMRVNHAGALLDGGRVEEAVALFGTAVADMRDIGDPHQLATSLLNYGVMLSTQLQRFEEADDCFHEAIQLARASDSPLTEGRAVYQLARSRGLQGDVAGELPLLAGAAAVFERIGDRGDQAECLERLADALLRVGQQDEAREVWHRATAVLQEIGDVTVTETRARLSPTLSATASAL